MEIFIALFMFSRIQGGSCIVVFQFIQYTQYQGFFGKKVHSRVFGSSVNLRKKINSRCFVNFGQRTNSVFSGHHDKQRMLDFQIAQYRVYPAIGDVLKFFMRNRNTMRILHRPSHVHSVGFDRAPRLDTCVVVSNQVNRIQNEKDVVIIQIAMQKKLLPINIKRSD